MKAGKIILSAALFAAGAAAGAGGLLGLRAAGIDPAKSLGWDEKGVAKDETSQAGIANPSDLELKSMLAEVARTKQRLEEQQRQLGIRSQVLDQEKYAMERMKKEIEETEKRINAGVTAKDEAEGKNTKRLAKMWSQMNPSEVAEVARELEMPFTARVLHAMNDRQAAPILAAMSAAGTEGAKRAAAIIMELKTIRESTVLSNKPAATEAQP